MSPIARLPVTLIGGFLGSGKTSLLHEIISEHEGGHLAVLVENPGTLNLDAKAVRGLCGAMRRTQDTVLEIPAGDEAAQAEWMAARLREFSEAGRYERVLVEVAGTSNAARLGEHFGLAPGQPGTFAPWAELGQIICVVDALDYFRAGRGPVSEAALWDFQNEQIASASLVVLNKCDLLDDGERMLCTSALRRLHPGLRIVETAYGEMPDNAWAQTATAEELRAAFARLQKLSAQAPPMPDLAAALYRVYRPFHPGRFWEWFNAEHHGLLRIKGIIWLATRNLLVGGISRTRWQNGCGTAGIWWAALPREDWPQEPETLMQMQETWREPYGDRRQELVLLGDALELSGPMRRRLDACLLTDAEFAQPFKEWEAFPDPFPEWDLEG
jgi:G3E family GTPase